MPVLPVTDPDRARSFYEKRLGFEVRPAGPGSKDQIVECGGGTRLRLHPVAEHPRPETTAAGFQVTDLASIVDELEARGVAFEDYDLPELKTEGHIAASPEGRSAWFHDSEGNLLCLDEPS